MPGFELIPSSVNEETISDDSGEETAAALVAARPLIDRRAAFEK